MSGQVTDTAQARVARVLAKKEFAGFVAALAKDGEVWAPKKVADKNFTRFGPVEKADEIDLELLNTKLPAKEIFFPQREVLFRFKPGQQEETEPAARIRERVVLGVRPCDAAALLLFDRVFLDEKFLDPYYEERRKKTALVGLGCNTPGESCFCTAVAGDPHGLAALDLLLVDLGDRFLARPVTDKGEGFVAGLPQAGKDDLKKAEELRAAAVAAMRFELDPAALKARLDKSFSSEVWEELALPCLNCGVCTYVCPTCHCFDVTDETRRGAGERVRTWDSCQFTLFTRHASGHNPRPTGRDRLRQRTLHKFRYFPETHGPVLCVGCGRCIIACPAGIDLKQTLERLGANEEQGTTETQRAEKE